MRSLVFGIQFYFYGNVDRLAVQLKFNNVDTFFRQKTFFSTDFQRQITTISCIFAIFFSPVNLPDCISKDRYFKLFGFVNVEIKKTKNKTKYHSTQLRTKKLYKLTSINSHREVIRQTYNGILACDGHKSKIWFTPILQQYQITISTEKFSLSKFQRQSFPLQLFHTHRTENYLLFSIIKSKFML